jgi:predicted membrane channel-forming protein YqfA (hemolysin III family)
MSKFRTPAWRSFRAGMFVSIGLSAIFPVLHGLHRYGMSQMRQQIGLSWLVLQGTLYVLGAGIYAVSLLSHPTTKCLDCNLISSSVYRKSGFLGGTIYWEARIRSSMSWWSWLLHRISLACSKHSIIVMVSQVAYDSKPYKTRHLTRHPLRM